MNKTSYFSVFLSPGFGYKLSFYLHTLSSEAGFFMKKTFPYFFVFVQLASLLYLLLSGHVIASSPHGMLVEASGIFFGLLAIYTMKVGNFRITPLIKENGTMVDSGPYRYIRHPMYLAQLVAVAPLVVDYFTYSRLAVFILLTLAFLLKIRFEERLLSAHFPGYRAYAEKTWRMIPFIY